MEDEHDVSQHNYEDEMQFNSKDDNDDDLIIQSKYVIDGMTEQEIARQPLEEIPLQQWIHLVHYWFSNKGKIGSEIGKRARAQQVAPHTSGSESFARKMRKFKKKYKRNPAPLEWYSIIHKHKDGAFVNQASEQLVVLR
ncbi:uncharacterized protein LOC125190640 [Salvia hispanica]|uniref:uncharacterized protein LOC125190640 n=1 Tax=Salvia hispanica TaxID=49212 RepID=UPI002009C927|nr:uncharacterized protein LOC125190640 [Salvia hispanica]